MQQKKYLTDPEAHNAIRDRGVPIGKNALKDHRSRGTGPKYAIINGRALYTTEWIDAWIAEQAARPLRRHRKKIDQNTASAS